MSSVSVVLFLLLYGVVLGTTSYRIHLHYIHLQFSSISVDSKAKNRTEPLNSQNKKSKKSKDTSILIGYRLFGLVFIIFSFEHPYHHIYTLFITNSHFVMTNL